MPRPAQALLTFLAALAPAQAVAHPHVFVDGRVAFVTDAAQRLTAVRITWVLDPLYSMMLLMELGLDPVARPDPEGRATLAGLHDEWIDGFGGGGLLSGRDGAVVLAQPTGAAADLVDGRIEIMFERALDAPLSAGEPASLLLYDPAYFVAYTIEEATVDGRSDCAVALQPFEPDAAMAGLQRQLALLQADAVVPEPGIGRLFSDRALLRCD